MAFKFDLTTSQFFRAVPDLDPRTGRNLLAKKVLRSSRMKEAGNMQIPADEIPVAKLLVQLCQLDFTVSRLTAAANAFREAINFWSSDAGKPIAEELNRQGEGGLRLMPVGMVSGNKSPTVFDGLSADDARLAAAYIAYLSGFERPQDRPAWMLTFSEAGAKVHAEFGTNETTRNYGKHFDLRAEFKGPSGPAVRIELSVLSELN